MKQPLLKLPFSGSIDWVIHLPIFSVGRIFGHSSRARCCSSRCDNKLMSCGQ